MVRTCDSFQKYAKVQWSPAEPLQIMPNPWPIATWRIDILGPFLIATAQKKFIVVVVDYFTKCIEAEALATITERQMEYFIWKSIVCRVGIPCLIIKNNGAQFQGKFKSFCKDLQITIVHSSVKTPQTNSQVEAMNKKILMALKKKVDEAKGDWLEELLGIIWAL